MCGICGYVNFSENKREESVIQNMVKTLHHRGPDSQGYYEDQEHHVFLGHSRLSIIDISDNGRQPMSFGNYTIVFNGEIYNYKEIKEELMELGHSFKTSSDTEVILHSYQEWGNDCAKRFIGMFAFAIYDIVSQTITLFRDRAGVKPLYYYFDQQAFMFGSELKAFHQNQLFHKELDYDSLKLYMKYGYIPTPHCVFKNTFKLVQGSYLIFNINKKTVDVQRYWDLKSFYTKPKLDISYNDALHETERIMNSAFQYRMVADVPVGVFLSAGFDSTCVATLLQKERTDKLRTFTIGFEFGNNEAPMAKEIAAYLGTDHSEHYCSEAEALSIIKDLPYYYDEPFADGSAIPTTLVSKIARQQVKVALSADGGDEIFAGYTSYASFLEAYRKIKSIPERLNRPIGYLTNIVKSVIAAPVLHRRLYVLSEVLLSNKELSSNLSEIIHETGFIDYDKGSVFVDRCKNIKTVYNEGNEDMTLLSRLLYADYVQYMQDDVLVKVDRATMSASLEGRNPFLDHRIVEYASQLPDEYKYHQGVKKRILKDIVYKYVPQKLVDRPKSGFTIPMSRWLDHGLIEYVDYYLSDNIISDYHVLNQEFVSDVKRRYNKNKNLFAFDVWKLLQFQMWYDRWMK